MTSTEKAFFAFPSKPQELSRTISTAINTINSGNLGYRLESWEENDVSGIPLTDPIFSKISTCKFLAADITFLNENVAFEIGYAVGCKRRCCLFVNSSMRGDRDLAEQIGIFDTLGFEKYGSPDELAKLISGRTNFVPLDFRPEVNHSAPIYIVEPAEKNDPHIMLVSRIKKAGWRFRSFSPQEDVRLSAMDALRHVAQSAGVVAPLQASATQAREHNIRSMFVAGLSMALEIPTLIIHSTEFVPPLDVRDLTKKYSHPNDIVDSIQEFSVSVTEYCQQSKPRTSFKKSLLGSLSVGDPTAENEMTTLGDYYLSTDEYQRAVRGEVNLVVGRKGTGKTALFVQLRDTKRSFSKGNVIVDLKPEGYQLIKLKERVLDFMTAGAQAHFITALWEYVLLLEITYKVLEKDRSVHLRDHTLTRPYTELRSVYGDTDLSREGDFRERLSKLSDYVIQEFLGKYASGTTGDSEKTINITTNQITELLYRHDIKKLYDLLVHYLSLKEEVWLLFDNIDKGWSVEGIDNEDILILRSLINASRKIEREFKKENIYFRSIVFVRDDVYSLLMKESPDYGKEMRASLDWPDRDQLAEVLKRRVIVSLIQNGCKGSDNELAQVAVSHYNGEPWLTFMAGRSLMRPRNLLKLFRYCTSYAINASHNRIEVEDIARGLRTYAQDLVIEVNRELVDVFPKAEKLIYEFSEENSEFSPDELSTLIQCTGMSEDDSNRVISFLLYYGILWVRRLNEDAIYIYDVNYDIEMMKVRIRKWGQSTKYVVNPALWPALDISNDHQIEPQVCVG